ncbi:VOC family protein [Candidatus Bathyarchaeota archaeon]|nr:VOC family protein [Candidatus Bathyarchaeota archaeon]
MKPTIGLVTVLTDDVDPMKAFYRDVLGFEVIEDLGRYVEFSNTGTRFAICTREVMHTHTGHPSYAEQRRGQSFELAFPAGTPDEVDEHYVELLRRGAESVKPPETMPWGRRTAFIADPDGNIHELFSLRPGEQV